MPLPSIHNRSELGAGIGLSIILAVIAWFAGMQWPLVGGPVFGIILGVLVSNIRPLPATFSPGIAFTAKKVLQWSIIVLGFGLSLKQVTHTGMSSLAVTLVTITVAFVSAWLLGKWLGIPSKLKILIGVGTAICGGSAIAAASPIIKANEHEVAFSISTIFLFNLIAVLVFPFFGHVLGLSDYGFGLWAGTAINDTSSVVAAGYSYSNAAGDFGTIVKLTRATLIIPVCIGLLLLQIWQSRQQRGQFRLGEIFPWFILWFVVASAIRTTGILPDAVLHVLAGMANFLIIVALSAVGLSANLRQMIQTGYRPIVLGLAVWACVACSSLLIQLSTGQL